MFSDELGLPLDVSLRQASKTIYGGANIPLHGNTSVNGAFNVIDSEWMNTYFRMGAESIPYITTILLQLQEGAPGMEHGADPEAYWAWLEGRFRQEDAQVAIGLYGEVRDVYKGEQFATAASPEWRSQHLGQDIFKSFGPGYEPLVAGAATMLVYWLIVAWMDKNRIRIRI